MTMKKLYALTLLVLTLASPLPAKAATLTLNDCLALAASGNRSLKAKAFDETIAAQSVTLADSFWYPRIDLQGGYTVQAAEQKIQLNNTSIATQDAHYGFFSLTLNYLLYDFGRREARSHQAELLQEATSDRYQSQEKDLFLEVVKGYYGILRSGKLLLATDDEVTRLTDHLRVAQHLHEQGVVTRNDVLQAEVRLAGSRQRRLSARNEVEKAWLLLNYLTGQPETMRAELNETTPFTGDMGPVNDDAVTARPEFRAQVKAVEAGEFDVTENKKAFFPEVFIKAGVDYIENSMVKEQAIYAATLGVRFNIFEGNATSARLRQAVARRSQDEARLNDLTAQLRLELATATRDATVAKERIGVTEQAISQADENVRINNNRYVEKVGTATELLDAQTLLTQTRVDYYTALYDYQVALARVKKALGEL
jgi:outer membrane protein TolC